MRNALTMLLIGMGQIILAALYPHAAWLLLWSGLSFGIVGTAYAFQKPRVFGKRLDGTLAWGNCLLLLPYLLLTWLLWYCQTHLTFEAASHEIVPGLWLGRRVSRAELPIGITLIVDLTSEFVEPRDLRTAFAYLCLPTLDNAAPDKENFAAIVQEIADCQEPVYIHCALGHGRSALVMAAVLMERRLVTSPEEVLVLIQQVRPGVRWNRAQQKFLSNWRH